MSLTLGFTACNDDDENYITTAEINAEKIKSLNITEAKVYFTSNPYYQSLNGFYDVSIDGNILVLRKQSNGYTFYVPLENVKYIANFGSYEIYI